MLSTLALFHFENFLVASVISSSVMGSNSYGWIVVNFIFIDPFCLFVVRRCCSQNWFPERFNVFSCWCSFDWDIFPSWFVESARRIYKVSILIVLFLFFFISFEVIVICQLFLFQFFQCSFWNIFVLDIKFLSNVFSIFSDFWRWIYFIICSTWRCFFLVAWLWSPIVGSTFDFS